MDAKIKAKWVKALRSGKYQQGRAFLERAGAYCCLGVLCKVMGRQVEQNENHEEIPPRAILDAAGLHHKTAQKLADKNDGSGGEDHAHSFNEIAAYIEKRL